ncbi:protein kinase domain containing protein [Stylonychia lemnae]|uniref:Protein kinase domain containing protein n=1 Tax=Stylonychia lemnae TaxID=5949 RepID=A0A078AA93_STYLE|nr:protein kinase domain containing protein [Stylonychia lemnae]|eukprot:CDW78492.1 protein kinase domain containing protein [Stylonychia lemnae]
MSLSLVSLLPKKFYYQIRRSRLLEIDAHLDTKRLKCQESMIVLFFINFRGGIAVVWLGQKNGEYVAMKQFPKQGSEHIAQLLDSVEDKKDLWLIYELCKGRSLNECLFEVKGEFYKVKDFIIRMCEALSLFSRLGIVHADLKPDNILIDYDEQNKQLRSLKIIDFGSAFMLSADGKMLKDQREFAMSTPEYLPPEIQQYLSRRFTSQNNYTIEDFQECAFVFDIWSLGSILLEILSGFPIWLSLKSRVKGLDGRHIINYGIFGVQGRDNSKILQKQHQTLSNGMPTLKKVLKKGFDAGGNILIDNSEFMDVMGQMLDWNPNTRISPNDVLKHKFLQQALQQVQQLQ